jgi:hypothetical protein
MARRSRGSSSALFRSMQSQANTQQAFQDRVMSDKWDSSAKTNADAQAYLGYLSDRAASTTDPSKQLTLSTRIKTATRAYLGASVNRITTSQKYGEAGYGEKLSVLKSAQDQAMQLGDENLAQSLEGQIASTKQAMISEQERNAAKADKAFQKALYGAYTAGDPGAVDEKGNIIDPTGLGTKQIDKQLALLKKDLDSGAITSTNYEHLRGGLVSMKEQILTQASADDRLSPETMAAFDTQHISLQTGGDAKYLSMDYRQKVANGQLPTAIKREDGIDSVVPLKPIGRNADGTLDYGKNRVQGGGDGSPGSFTYIRNNPAGKEQAYQTTDVLGMSNSQDSQDKQLLQGLLTTTDPVTGKTLYLKKDPKTGTIQRSLVPWNEQGFTPDATPLDIAKRDAGWALQSVKSLPGVVNNAIRGIASPVGAVARAVNPPVKTPPVAATPAQTKSAIGAINSAVGNRSYLDPYKTSLGMHYNIISSGTNYGGTVDQLKKAGVTEAQLARDGAYDKALRAANDNGQFR